MTIIGRYLFWLFVFALACLAAPVTLKVLLKLADLLYLWLGVVCFLLLYFMGLKKRLGFLQTLDHELSHMLVSLLFGNTMVEMYVHDRMGGHVKYRGRGHVLISLAPYVLRLPVLAAMLMAVLAQAIAAVKISHFFSGMALCYAAISIYEEAKPHQSDLTQNGLCFSYAAIVALNIIWLGFIGSAMLPKVTALHYIKAVIHW